MSDQLTVSPSHPSQAVSESSENLTDPQLKTRLLLTLWELGELVDGQKMLRKSELTAKIKRKRNGKKLGNCQEAYTELSEAGAIEVRLQDRVYYVFLTAKGTQLLGEGLQDPGFVFEGNVVAAWLVNALLHWMREFNVEIGGLSQGEGAGKLGVPGPTVDTVPVDQSIKSYEEFREVALEVYNRLNEDYNLSHLVPIYRIRRQIGERVSRSQFRDWLLEMQANNILQLIGGDLTDVSSDQIEDSVKTSLGKIRYYAQSLIANN